jgi:serine/threonine protein phosphatase PrpC
MKKIKIFPQGNGHRARDQRQQPEPSGGEAADHASRPHHAAEPAMPSAASAGPPGTTHPTAAALRVPGEPSSAAGPNRVSGPAWPGQPGGNERWAPIVVDEPIFDFEPKPPSAVSDYRPDTVYDGWSTGDFTVRLASVRGYSHRYNGLPRQDDVAAGFDPGSGTVLFAVADGVSSARQSHIGAAIACTTLIEEQRWMLDNRRAIDLPGAVTKAASRMIDRAAYLLRQDAPGPEAIEGLLATTLIAGYITPSPPGAVAVLVQIGDSGAWVLQGGRYYPLLEQKNDPNAQIISSAVSPLPRLPDRITPATYQLPADAVLIVGSDGFGDPLGDGDGHVGQLFAEHLSAPPPARGLAHLLDFSRDTFDDDRTLLAIWQQPRRPVDPR